MAKKVARPARISVKKYEPLRSLGYEGISPMNAIKTSLVRRINSRVQSPPDGSTCPPRCAQRRRWHFQSMPSKPCWTTVGPNASKLKKQVARDRSERSHTDEDRILVVAWSAGIRTHKALTEAYRPRSPRYRPFAFSNGGAQIAHFALV